MTINLNGDPFELSGPTTVAVLLADLSIDPRRVAVEHNLIVLKRQDYGTTTINEGDQVEIVNFVGGGTNDCEARSLGAWRSGGRLRPGQGCSERRFDPIP